MVITEFTARKFNEGISRGKKITERRKNLKNKKKVWRGPEWHGRLSDQFLVLDQVVI